MMHVSHRDDAETLLTTRYVDAALGERAASVLAERAQAGRYDDTLVRENGRWKFKRRVASNDTPPPAGSEAEQFENFCAENPGAC